MPPLTPGGVYQYVVHAPLELRGLSSDYDSSAKTWLRASIARHLSVPTRDITITFTQTRAIVVISATFSTKGAAVTATQQFRTSPVALSITLGVAVVRIADVTLTIIARDAPLPPPLAPWIPLLTERNVNSLTESAHNDPLSVAGSVFLLITFLILVVWGVMKRMRHLDRDRQNEPCVEYLTHKYLIQTVYGCIKEIMRRIVSLGVDAKSDRPDAAPAFPSIQDGACGNTIDSSLSTLGATLGNISFDSQTVESIVLGGGSLPLASSAIIIPKLAIPTPEVVIDETFRLDGILCPIEGKQIVSTDSGRLDNESRRDDSRNDTMPSPRSWHASPRSLGELCGFPEDESSPGTRRRREQSERRHNRRFGPATGSNKQRLPVIDQQFHDELPNYFLSVRTSISTEKMGKPCKDPPLPGIPLPSAAMMASDNEDFGKVVPSRSVEGMCKRSSESQQHDGQKTLQAQVSHDQVSQDVRQRTRERRDHRRRPHTGSSLHSKSVGTGPEYV